MLSRAAWAGIRARGSGLKTGVRPDARSGSWLPVFFSTPVTAITSFPAMLWHSDFVLPLTRNESGAASSHWGVECWRPLLFCPSKNLRACARLLRRRLAAGENARSDFHLVVVAIGGPERPDEPVETATGGGAHGDDGGHPESLAAEQDGRVIDRDDALAGD